MTRAYSLCFRVLKVWTSNVLALVQKIQSLAFPTPILYQSTPYGKTCILIYTDLYCAVLYIYLYCTYYTVL